ncbi:RNA 2',3'-cyclic phosphodiesterase [Candidatus Woesearchaeota archaeon]|nr:RNA 2',3'-cyclic phosphodiesterase [Candidatus Woesearchaeota archaeon]
MRLFLALLLPPEIRKELVALYQSIPPSLGKITWVAEENIHLTIKFLGEVPQEKLSLIKHVLAQVHHHPFDLQLTDIGAFPKLSNPRVIWVGVMPHETVVLLQKQIDDALAKLGFSKDLRFHPHITLGRVKIVHEGHALTKMLSSLPLKPRHFTANEFSLMQSTLTPKGPVYQNLSRENKDENVMVR